jgi:hypothetical protein
MRGLLFRIVPLLVLTLLLPVISRAQQLTVFAAASLTDAMKDVSAAWEKQGHPALRMSFGASSTLARQIEQGAPANLFASANERWMDYLAKANLIAPDTRKDLLSNQLVLIVPKSYPLKVTIGPDLNLNDLLGPDGLIVTGDPARVPVGFYEHPPSRLGLEDISASGIRGLEVSAETFVCCSPLIQRAAGDAGLLCGLLGSQPIGYRSERELPFSSCEL